jgi:aspartyl-tRNA(Asn)/glutamyl-tRNA(Gln) amidotransferase subunit B
MSWEAVIGMEVHVQLRTSTKLFCPDSTSFGAEPNTHVCPVCLGLPGALPTTNPEAVELAVKTALALECTVHPTSVWARKNYFYPDLPKGYQITQFERPLATGGRVAFDGESGEGVVRIRRIHMEEDAGKSIHDRFTDGTAVDLNRAGTPLVEIVTEPDLRSPADVRSFLQTLKRILEYVDVSDCNMEEGSLRADANVSLRPVGSDELGVKTEIKNVNSFSGIEKALTLEIERQRAVLDQGAAVRQQTLLWDDHRAEIRPMRSKEESHDYRYFPDPDLPPLVLDEAWIGELGEALPELPRARRRRFEETFGLPAYDADVLTQSAVTADYFEAVASAVPDPKSASNWIMGPVQALMNERAENARTFPVPPASVAELLALVDGGTLSQAAAKKVLGVLAEEGGRPADVVDRLGLAQVRDDAQLEAWVDEVLVEHPDEAERYREGEARLVGFFVGQVMRRSGGKADPKRVNELVQEKLG